MNLINIFDLPENLTGIPKTFVTEQYELYIIGDTEDEFVMYFIDLDNYEDKYNKEN